MKAHLLYADRDLDFDPQAVLAESELEQDLELGALLGAMAGADDYLRAIARTVLLDGLRTPQEIAYRQDILDDCTRQPDIPVAIYRLATQTIQAEHQVWGGLFSSASYTLHRSMQVMELFVAALRQLRTLASEHREHVTSAGLRQLFDMLAAELSDEYLSEIEDHLTRLRFRGGMLLSARLTSSNKGTDYVLRKLPDSRPGIRGMLSAGRGRPGSTLVVADRDISGQRTLSDLRDKGTELVADALAQSCAHILSFFEMLRRESAFYVGCVAAHDALVARGQPVCRPGALPGGTHQLAASGLYDPALALTLDGPVIGNEVAADGAALVMVTGANQGGKSTFLRSVGLAQLMTQCGMFAPASSFRSSISTGIFTHYKRSEDRSMTSGKLDEELARMSEITRAIRPGGLLLCNESFAATNEREGSHLARSITRALLDSGVRVVFVTHFHDLASGFYRDDRADALFLRAVPEPDGTRTYRITEGPPMQTGHAADVFQHVFGEPLVQTAATR